MNHAERKLTAGYVHQREGERNVSMHKRAWYKSPLVVSVTAVSGLCVAIGIILVTLARAQEYAYCKAMEPRVRCTAAEVVSDSVKIFREMMVKVMQKLDRNDSNTIIVKSILEVTTTPDDLVQAQNRRNNPTGIQ